MKRALLVIFAAVLMLSGCSQKTEPDTIKDGKSLSDVLAAVDVKFEEKYGLAAVASMPMEIDQQTLIDFYSLEAGDVEEMAGSYSAVMVNSDTLVALKASQGNADKVFEGAQKRLADIVSQFENYNVNGSHDRALAGEVYRRGDYVFLIVVGHPTGGVENMTFDFASDVAMTKAAIDSMFN